MRARRTRSFLQMKDSDIVRQIATEAGLSPSNAYYYFSGKDELVQELYRQLQVEHRQAAAPGIVVHTYYVAAALVRRRAGIAAANYALGHDFVDLPEKPADKPVEQAPDK